MKALKIEPFRILVMIFALLLVVDQMSFWSWTTDGEFVPVTLLSFLPVAFWESVKTYYGVSGLCILSGVLWLIRFKPRITSVITTLSFALAASFYLQNLPFGDHRQAVIVFLLALLAAEEFGYLKSSFFYLAGLALCSLYFFAGWEKLILTGLSWPNGISLQIFVQYLGREGSFLRAVLLEHRGLAQALQWIMLILECGVLALFISGPLRWFFLLGLLGFHIGLEEIFFYRFFPLYILLFYVFGWDDLKRYIYARKT